MYHLVQRTGFFNYYTGRNVRRVVTMRYQNLTPYDLIRGGRRDNLLNTALQIPSTFFCSEKASYESMLNHLVGTQPRITGIGILMSLGCMSPYIYWTPSNIRSRKEAKRNRITKECKLV